MKRRKIVRRKPDKLEQFQNDVASLGKNARRAVWNFYSWIGLIALIYIIISWR